MLTPGEDMQIPFLADKELVLRNTTCENVSLSLDSNVLEITVSRFAVAQTQACTMTISFANATSVVYAVPIYFSINTSVTPNISVEYTPISLSLRNDGNGTGDAFVCDAADAARLSIDPGQSQAIPAQGLVTVGLGVIGDGTGCASIIFSHTFAQSAGGDADGSDAGGHIFFHD